LKQNPSEGGSHQKLGFGSDGTDSDARNGSPAAGAHRRWSGWRGGAFRCLRAEESGEKLEFAARGRKLGRGSVGGLNRRENQRGRGGPAGAAMGHSHDAIVVWHERRQDRR
jgi:hypothetical protein